MTNDELKEYYHSNDVSGHNIKRSIHRTFVRHLKSNFDFISKMKGRKEISIYIHALLNDIHSPPLCATCENPINSAHSIEFPKTCSRKCNGHYVANNAKTENLRRYGVEYHTQREDVKKKSRESSRRKWGTDHYLKSDEGKRQYRKTLKSTHGVENVFQLESVKRQTRETNTARYGYPSAIQNVDIQNKSKETYLKKYGVDNPMKSPVIRLKSMKTSIERYGVDNPMKSPTISSKVAFTMTERYGHSTFKRSQISSDTHEVLSSKDTLKGLYDRYGIIELEGMLGVDNTTIYNWLDIHGIARNGISSLEISFESFLKQQSIEYERNNRTVLGGLEIDFYIPSLKLGVELNGIYYHSSKFKDNRYHLNKTKSAERNGVQLIHIFEDEWNYRREQCEAKLKYIFGVDDRKVTFARKTEYCSLTKEEISPFLEKHHIQGFTGGFLYKGLRENGRLVAAAAFRRSNGECHLNRYATSDRVVGGLSKIIKNVSGELIDCGYDGIVSFADIRWSSGKLYESTGWKLERTLPPDYQYVVGDKRIRKQNYRRKFLPEKLEFFDPVLSETENMRKNNIHRVFDCGLRRYLYEII